MDKKFDKKFPNTFSRDIRQGKYVSILKSMYHSIYYQIALEPYGLDEADQLEGDWHPTNDSMPTFTYTINRQPRC